MPDPAYPQLTSKQHTVMGMNQDNHDLIRRGERRREMDVENQAECGADAEIRCQQSRITWWPPEKNQRIGVDRDAQGNAIGAGGHPAKDFASLFA